MPEDLPPLPKGKRYPYVQWGDCSKCGIRFPMTEYMVRKTTGLSGKPALPTCGKCRWKVDARRRKRGGKVLGKPECRFAAKLSSAKMAKMHLRQAPASGTPLWCSLKKRWYVLYFLGKSRNRVDEQRAYLDALKEDEAIGEARDWYTRALLHGAKWLPDDFTAEAAPPDEDILKTRRILKSLRSKGRRVRKPRKVVVRKRQIRSYVMVDRWAVLYNNRIVRSDLKTRKAADKLAEATRSIHRTVAKEAGLQRCVKCGKKPVWDGKTLVHDGDDYCPNAVMIRDLRFSRNTRIALWNLVLRHGDYGGWWDFRFEHILLMEKIKNVIPDRKKRNADPLEGFEI